MARHRLLSLALILSPTVAVGTIAAACAKPPPPVVVLPPTIPPSASRCNLPDKVHPCGEWPITIYPCGSVGRCAYVFSPSEGRYFRGPEEIVWTPFIGTRTFLYYE